MIYHFLTCNIWDFNATWLLSFLFVLLSARHFQFFLLFANVAICPGLRSSFRNNLKNKKKEFIFDRKFTKHGHKDWSEMKMTRLWVGHFKTISGHFFNNYIKSIKSNLLIFFHNSKCNNELKKIFFDKTENHDLFISPKRKNAVLEMSLKSSIMSKLDHQMSKIWIEFAGPLL